MRSTPIQTCCCLPRRHCSSCQPILHQHRTRPSVSACSRTKHCQFCHGIDGDGRGDPRSPGQAADLHKTILNREQLIEVITCGRPGTEMPHFDRFAYEDKSCYGRTAAELGNDTPHDPHSTSLTKREIEAVADYIFAKFVGK
jgi:hypothetical protein